MVEPTEVVKKPYDLKGLSEKFKSKGLNIAEDAVAKVFEEVLVWFQEEALKTATPLDDLLASGAVAMKAQVLSVIDKIDGEDDPGR